MNVIYDTNYIMLGIAWHRPEKLISIYLGPWTINFKINKKHKITKEDIKQALKEAGEEFKV